MNKSLLREAILERLRADLSLQTAAAQLARDEAISEESRAENKYDTHSQEAAYLAEGQAKLAREIDQTIAQYATLPLPTFTADDAIAVGAVVELRGPRTSRWYFVGPRAGGAEVALDGRTILVVTPQSPLGGRLIGKRVGDTLPPTGREPAQQIASVA